MKKIMFFMVGVMVTNLTFGQVQTFDLVSYTPPKGWKKEIRENIALYSITNNKTQSWCQIGIVKSTVSKGSVEKDFESEWQELIVKNYKPSGELQYHEVQDSAGWKVKAAGAKFVFNNIDAMALLTTMSGFNRCISIVIITNSQNYLKDIEALLGSVDLKQPDTVSNQFTTVVPITTIVPSAFAFTTTNFDDGWVSTVQEDWVETKKGNIRILIHYPNKDADAYNSQLLEGLQNAWNILVVPKYSSLSNVEYKPIISWQSIEFAEADAIEKETGKQVHVVLFKKNAPGGKWLEFISPDKSSFEKEFGPYHATSYGWEKLENMTYYNKFAIGPADLSGKWTNNYSGTLQYVNVNTGLDAGMDSHASNENFQFNAGNKYNWDLGVASGPVGNIKFQSVKSSGKFSVPDNWRVSFSDIEGKPRTFNAHFSCIKGHRILWLGDQAYFKVN